MAVTGDVRQILSQGTDRRAKVLLLTQVYSRHKEDHQASFLGDFCQGLRRRGYTVCVLAPHEKQLSYHEWIDGIEVFRFKYAPEKYERIAYKGHMHELVFHNFLNKMLFLLFSLSFFWNGLKIARKNNIQIIHAHWWIPSGVVGTLIKFLTRKPLVITIHGEDAFLLRKVKWLVPLAKVVLRSANQIIAVSSPDYAKTVVRC